jgi:lipopolysaccharide export system ATP-binding protein
MPLLAANNLCHQIHGKTILDDLSLHVNVGEIVGLLGPNGAGKTSCFYALTGLVKMTSGQVLLNDQDISNLPLHQRARLGLGYLPQEASIFRGMSVADNLNAALELQTHLTPEEQNQKRDHLLQQFRLESCAQTLGCELSGGERRRAEIARALVNQPKIILLDEPFAGIDPRSIHDTKQLIQQLAKQNISVLITDHNARDTLGICDRAYIVAEGKVLAHGPPKEIMFDQNVRQIYLGEHF